MDGILLVFLFVVGIVLAARRSQLKEEISVLRDQLESATARISTLERVVMRRKGAEPQTPEPAPVAEPAEPPPAPESVPLSAREPAPRSAPEPPPLFSPLSAPLSTIPSAPSFESPSVPNPLVAWFLRGNPLAKVGVILLFFGLGYLLKFANDRGMLPIELRLSAAALISIGLLVVGWRLRRSRPVYALTLQGGSIGALYLTSFAAFRVYGLLPHGLVFALLIVICAACVTLAVAQNAQSLAMLASLGGYLAPILLSTGGGNHVALFTYYGLLSLGILAVSIWKAWRPLTLIGFGFTFGIGAAWGADRYQPELYASVQFFLILNLLLYGVLAVLMALRHTGTTEDTFVDGTLAFGTPLIGFGFQVAITQHWEYGPAFSSLGFGALYLPLALFTMRRWPERGRQIALIFLALGATFVTLAIPLALSARWTAMAWALEGIGLLWTGRTQHHTRMTWSGTFLLTIAAGAAFRAWTDGIDTATFLMLGMTVALTWLAGSWLWRGMEKVEGRETISLLMLSVGMIVWQIVVFGGSDRLTPNDGQAILLSLVWASASALVWHLAGTGLNWTALRQCALLLWPSISVLLPVHLALFGHALNSPWSVAAWSAGVLTMWQLLRLSRGEATSLLAVQHGWFLWLLFALSSSEVQWRLDGSGWGAEEWRVAGVLTVTAAFVLVVSLMSRGGHWAVQAFPKTYWIAGLIPVGVTAAAVLVAGNLLDGRVPDLPYIPIVNVLEEPAIFMLLMAGVWYRALTRLFPMSVVDLMPGVIIGYAVYWANGALLRTLAIIADVGWSFELLWASAFIQTSMALAWTVVALFSMAIAARLRQRTLWFAGATALGLVIVKLALVDSVDRGGLERAVAFIGVALLILVIGYLAPLPPREADEAPADGGTS